MSKPFHHKSIAVIAAAVLLGSVSGAAFAQSATPQTGSAQGVNPSNSLPGGSGAFGSSPAASGTPLTATPPSGAAQGVVTSPDGNSTGASTTITGAPQTAPVSR